MAPPSNSPGDGGDANDHQPDMLPEDDAQEVVAGDGDDEDDVAMDSDLDDEGQEEIILQNDSVAYFDSHRDSVFAIAQHPIFRHLIATGGSEGDSDDAPGKGYVLDLSAVPSRPVLPASFSSSGTPHEPAETTGLKPLFEIDGHADSINSLIFTYPGGDFLVSGGMDGRLRAYRVLASVSGDALSCTFSFVAESRETEEITWIAPSPCADHPNTIAVGAADGSVWVFTIETSGAHGEEPEAVQIVQSYFLHTMSCTAGAWTPDGKLLATVSEDGSLHVFDVWGEAAAQSLVTHNGQTVVSLTAADQRFQVEGGLYSVAIAPSSGLVAVGGAAGFIKIVGLPRLSPSPSQTSPAQAQSPRSTAASSSSEPSAQAGTILASLNVQTGGIESLSFSPTPSSSTTTTTTSSSSSSSSSSTNALLLAAGSVDGSIAIFEAGRGFAVRRHLRDSHAGTSVVQVEFVRAPPPGSSSWLLTSCGLDGVVRRWDLRAAASAGPAREWKGHAAGGAGAETDEEATSGGVLGFVQGDTGERVVTAGDDALVLVFEA